METVTVSGKVYQIGGLYMDGSGRVVRLRDVVGESMHVFISSLSQTYESVSELHEVRQLIGTITDAPIELEDGKWYSFTVNEEYGHGEYRKDRRSFFSFNNKVCGEREAKRIEVVWK